MIVNVQPEVNSNSFDQIDGSYLVVRDGFGEINLGFENLAMNKMHFAPAEFGIGINSRHQTGWVSPTTNAASSSITEGGYFRAPYGSTHIESIRANDSEKLTYFTPRLKVSSLACSMHRPPKDNISQPNRDIGFVIADRNLNCSFGSASILAFLRFGMVLDGGAGANPELSGFNAVLGLGFGGFSISFS